MIKNLISFLCLGLFALIAAPDALSADEGGGFLGVYLADDEGDSGAVVRDCVDGSPALKAGFQAGDRIISFNDQPIKSRNDLINCLMKSKAGAEAAIQVARGDSKVTLKVTLAKREVPAPEPEESVEIEEVIEIVEAEPTVKYEDRVAIALGKSDIVKMKKANEKLLMELKEAHGQPKSCIGVHIGKANMAVLITGVIDGGPAHKAGIMNGDQILSINGKEIETIDKLAKVVSSTKPGKGLVVKLLRGGKLMKTKMKTASYDKIFAEGDEPKLVEFMFDEEIHEAHEAHEFHFNTDDHHGIMKLKELGSPDKNRKVMVLRKPDVGHKPRIVTREFEVPGGKGLMKIMVVGDGEECHEDIDIITKKIGKEGPHALFLEKSCEEKSSCGKNCDCGKTRKKQVRMKQSQCCPNCNAPKTQKRAFRVRRAPMRQMRGMPRWNQFRGNSCQCAPRGFSYHHGGHGAWNAPRGQWRVHGQQGCSSHGNVRGHSGCGGDCHGNVRGHSGCGGDCHGNVHGQSGCGGDCHGDVRGHSGCGGDCHGDVHGHSGCGGDCHGDVHGHSGCGGDCHEEEFCIEMLADEHDLHWHGDSMDSCCPEKGNLRVGDELIEYFSAGKKGYSVMKCGKPGEGQGKVMILGGKGEGKSFTIDLDGIHVMNPAGIGKEKGCGDCGSHPQITCEGEVIIECQSDCEKDCQKKCDSEVIIECGNECEKKCKKGKKDDSDIKP